VTLIQVIPIPFSSDDSTSTLKDLSYSFLLLIYSAPALTNSYKSNDDLGRESFLMSRRLYNEVTGKKNIESNFIVSYTNQNSRYNSLKENLKKTVISVNYAGNSNESQISSSSNKGKAKYRDKLNNQLDIIDEMYTKMNNQPSKKRKMINISLQSTSSKDNSSSSNFNDVFAEVRGEPTEQENSDETINNQEIDSD
ncbi:8101_t:CDS:2, partial [Cetraspora pellucida]